LKQNAANIFANYAASNRCRQSKFGVALKKCLANLLKLGGF